MGLTTQASGKKEVSKKDLGKLNPRRPEQFGGARSVARRDTLTKNNLTLRRKVLKQEYPAIDKRLYLEPESLLRMVALNSQPKDRK